jgi:hypothetical protein
MLYPNSHITSNCTKIGAVVWQFQQQQFANQEDFKKPREPHRSFETSG